MGGCWQAAMFDEVQVGERSERKALADFTSCSQTTNIVRHHILQHTRTLGVVFCAMKASADRWHHGAGSIEIKMLHRRPIPILTTQHPPAPSKSISYTNFKNIPSNDILWHMSKEERIRAAHCYRGGRRISKQMYLHRDNDNAQRLRLSINLDVSHGRMKRRYCPVYGCTPLQYRPKLLYAIFQATGDVPLPSTNSNVLMVFYDPLKSNQAYIETRRLTGSMHKRLA